jgi:cytochrome c peroxidase
MKPGLLPWGVVIIVALACGAWLWPAARGQGHQSVLAESRSGSPAAQPPAAALLGLPPRVIPADVPFGTLQIELGRKLFFDRRLSFNSTMSCAMCHVPEQGYASHASQTGVGIEGISLKRNAPSLLNVAWQALLFHDGRESSLVTQAWMPLLHPDEMANPSIGLVIQRVRALADYQGLFEAAYPGSSANTQTLGAALAAFELTLVAGGSRFDRWRYGGQSDALSALEQQGFALFNGKAGCAQCHTMDDKFALFSDGQFHATGAGPFARPPKAVNAYVVPLAPGVETVLDDKDLGTFATSAPDDVGRFDITLDAADRFAFKTPTLRNVAQSPPYMHDGSLPSLEAVIEFYNGGGGHLSNKSPLLRPLGLNAAEKQALLAFLHALDSEHLAALVAGSRPQTYH